MPKTLPLGSGIFDNDEAKKPLVDEVNEDLRLDGEKDPSFNNSVDASTVAAPGIVIDKFTGKQWTLPSGTFADAGLANYRSPRDIKKDPNFHYQFIRYAGDYPELDEYTARGYVPVTREELGKESIVAVGDPKPLDNYYTVDGKDICVKIPIQFAMQDYAQDKAFCDGAVQAARREGTVTKSTAQGRFSTAERLAGDGVDGEFSLRETTSRTEPIRVTK